MRIIETTKEKSGSKALNEYSTFVDVARKAVDEFIDSKKYMELIRIFDSGLDIKIDNLKVLAATPMHIYISCGSFFGKDLGIFKTAFKKVEIKTSNSKIVESDKDFHIIWQASWSLEYTTYENKTDEIVIFDTWCDLFDYTWHMKDRR